MSIVKVNGTNCLKYFDGKILYPTNQEETDFYNGKTTICKINKEYYQNINGIIGIISKEKYDYLKLSTKGSLFANDIITNIWQKLNNNYKRSIMVERLRKKLDAKKK